MNYLQELSEDMHPTTSTPCFLFCQLASTLQQNHARTPTSTSVHTNYIEKHLAVV